MSKIADDNQLTCEEDFFIEVKERKKLATPQSTEDVEYLLHNLYRVLGKQ